MTAVGRTTVVPLGDVAFSTRGRQHDEPGDDGWSHLQLGDESRVVRERPAFWRDYRRRKWIERTDGQFVCPDLQAWIG